MKRVMRDIGELTPQRARALRYVLCDIDDTITTGGKLPACAYSALWKLNETGIFVVPVTGRPAGWCDLIVREWPVAAVVGENGAFALYPKDGRIQTALHPNTVENAQQRLAALRERVLREVPGSRIAHDQFARIYDLAIDFAEDPPRLPLSQAKRIVDICQEMGAKAKLSSIHVNAWFGEYDKLSMTLRLLGTVFGEPEPEEHAIFFGDSPNDEPMFAHFPTTCAVSNILPFLDEMRALPAYTVDLAGGEGFAKAVDMILKKRLEA